LLRDVPDDRMRGLFMRTDRMKRFTIEVPTEGNTDIINLSPMLAERIREYTGEGLLHVFVSGSTVGLTTLEFEPGLVKHDLPNVLQKLFPDDENYHHEMTWNDDNGHAHIRSAFLRPEITIPYAKGKMLTGEWQQAVLIDFDTRPRRRTVIVTVVE
jgi:secondary thiamine-phosphate synthase enzyme